MRSSSFAHFNLTPEDVQQWRLEQQRLESFAAESRRLCRSAAAPAESISRQSVAWHLGASADAPVTTQLAAQGQNGLTIYAPLSGGHCCATTPLTTPLESAGAHHLAAFAGLSSHQQMSQAPAIPIESAANDLALQVANLRNPQRLRAIRHCLEDSQMSHTGPMMAPVLVPPQLATPALEHAHELSKPAHRRHNHRAEQKKVLREWFDKHALDPYPSNEEKVELAQKAYMDVKQVENCALLAPDPSDEPHTALDRKMHLSCPPTPRRVYEQKKAQLATCEGRRRACGSAERPGLERGGLLGYPLHADCLCSTSRNKCCRDQAAPSYRRMSVRLASAPSRSQAYTE